MTPLTQRLEDALLAAAGEGRSVVPVSFSIDYGASVDGAEPAIETRIDRATRTLVFASAEARLPDGRRAAAASGVYRVQQG